MSKLDLGGGNFIMTTGLTRCSSPVSMDAHHRLYGMQNCRPVTTPVIHEAP